MLEFNVRRSYFIMLESGLYIVWDYEKQKEVYYGNKRDCLEYIETINNDKLVLKPVLL